MWIAHTNTIQTLKENNPKSVRRYLNDTKDYTALIEWDKSQIKETDVE